MGAGGGMRSELLPPLLTSYDYRSRLSFLTATGPAGGGGAAGHPVAPAPPQALFSGVCWTQLPLSGLWVRKGRVQGCHPRHLMGTWGAA